ncbi:MAG TPA: hypothetical protein VHB79_16150 [Polyangiaceae bacterium]|nr:hypothetical protein [Polyangiaceae bacterium]
MAVGCGSTASDETHCVPGRQIACDCADGSTAVQVCGSDAHYLACQCNDDSPRGIDVPPTGSSGGRATAGSSNIDPAGGTAGISSGGVANKPIAYKYGDMSPCDTEGSSLFFSGDSGDYIHPGQDLLTVARFNEMSSPEHISFYIEPSGMEHGSWWYADFSSEQLDAPLAVGEYLGAERYPFETYLKPGLDVTGDGRGCNTLTGKFVIKKLVWLGPTLSVVDVAFEQHCEGGSAAVRGCLHYDSGLGEGGVSSDPQAQGGWGNDSSAAAGAAFGGASTAGEGG